MAEDSDVRAARLHSSVRLELRLQQSADVLQLMAMPQAAVDQIEVAVVFPIDQQTVIVAVVVLAGVRPFHPLVVDEQQRLARIEFERPRIRLLCGGR